jgi:hypothetical protein
MEADSLGTLNSALKASENKIQAQAQEQRAHEEKMAQMAQQQAAQEKQMELDHEAQENEKDRRKDLLVAEIKAAGYGAMQDLNQNMQSDFIDQVDKLKKTEQYQQTIDIQQQKADESKSHNASKQQVKREEMALKRELKEKDVQIAMENKNQYDFKNPKEKKDKKS